VFSRKQGVAGSCTPSFASKARVQLRAGSRRVHTLARYSGAEQRVATGGQGLSREGIRLLRWDRYERGMEQGMELWNVVGVAGFVVRCGLR